MDLDGIPKADLCTCCSDEVFSARGWAEAWTASRAPEFLDPVLRYKRECSELLASCWFCEQILDEIKENCDGPLPQHVSVELSFYAPYDIRPRRINSLIAFIE